jgi:hypothetical protein
MAKCRFRFEFQGSGESLLDTIRLHLERAGGEISGEVREGRFSLPSPIGAFRGTYSVSGQTILLDLVEKPFVVPCRAIESRLASYVKDMK